MPQVQVIRRISEQATQGLGDIGATMAEAMFKKQANELRKMEIDATLKDIAVKMKNAQTEEEKLALNLKKQKTEESKVSAEYMKLLQESGPMMGPHLLKYMIDNGIFSFDKMAEDGPKLQEIYKKLSDVEGSERNLRTQRGAAYEAQAESYKAKTMGQELLNKLLGGLPPEGATSGAAPSGAVAPSGAPSRPALELTSITGGQPTFESTEGKSRVASAEVYARETAKYEVEKAPVRKTLNNYVQQMRKASVEMGGLGKTPLGAKVKGAIFAGASEFSPFQALPNIQAVTKSLDATALILASLVNRGRPTEPDKEAAMRAMPTIYYPDATNEVLMSYWNSVLDSPEFNEQMAIPMGTMDNTASPFFMQAVEKANAIVEKDRAFVRKAQAQGYTPDEINEALRIIHQREGSLNGNKK